LRALLPLLDVKPMGGDWRKTIEDNVAEWWKTLEARALEPADPINPQRVFWELSKRLPDNAQEIFRQEDDTCHLAGTARMGADRRTSVVKGDCRSWDIPNLWVCDGSVFPINGGVNPSLTITSIAMRTVDRIVDLAARGEL
jgi:choline dehydrogenase-like flavoprotein